MPVRVGVVGAGKFGIVHLNAYKQLGYPGVAELAGIAKSSPEHADELSSEYGCPVYLDYREMIEKADIDAVSIVTPDHLHREVALFAINAGKHVLAEKPLDTSVSGCIDMVRAAEDAGVLLQVDFHKRYDPEHQAIRNRVQAGELGDILYGSAYMEDRIDVPVEWFSHWAANSSPAWFLGVHFYDLVRWILGSDAKRVYATGTKNHLLNDYGIDAFDCINAKVEFQNGAVFNFDTSWILPKGFEAIVNQEVRLVGTKGVWECDSQDRGSRSCIVEEGMRTYNNNFLREKTDRFGRTIYCGYGVESIEDFAYNVAFLKNGGSIDQLEGKYPSGKDGLAVTRIADAVHRSIQTGTPIDL